MEMLVNPQHGKMEDLRRQLAALDADQIKQLLSTSGHDALLTGGGKQVEEPAGVAVDVVALKAQGNALFQQRKFEEAARAYSQYLHKTLLQCDRFGPLRTISWWR
jgi:hypothetical protein